MATGHVWLCDYQHACKVERQRDEAKQNFAQAEASRIANAEMYERAITERDQARDLARGLRDVLALLVSDLPKNRDWLNPDTEKIAKAILKEAKEVLP